MIYHITHRPEWEAAVRLGTYTTLSLASQGFIHCSYVQQLERVANHYYPGQTELVILVINPHKLTSLMMIEKAVDVDDNFPHIYGPLNLDAVVKIVDFPSASDQLFSLPREIA